MIFPVNKRRLSDMVYVPWVAFALTRCKLLRNKLIEQELLLFKNVEEVGPCPEVATDPRLDCAKHFAFLVGGVAARMPFHCDCVVKSLALLQILKALGLPGKLVLGVKCHGQKFLAHAWVDLTAGEETALESAGFTPFHATKTS